jgi:hypothetical protein
MCSRRAYEIVNPFKVDFKTGFVAFLDRVVRRSRQRVALFMLHFCGYGIRIRIPFAIWLIAFVTTIGVFWSAESVEPAESQHETASRAFSSPTDANGNQWGFWDALWMAIRFQVPAVNTVALSDWKPSQRDGAFFGTMTYETYASVVTLLSWILVPVVLLALTGVLKSKR